MLVDNICFPLVAKISQGIPKPGKAISPPAEISRKEKRPQEPISTAISLVFPPGPAGRWARELYLFMKQGPDPTVPGEVTYPDPSE